MYRKSPSQLPASTVKGHRFSDVLPMDLDGFAKFLKTMLAKQPHFLEIVEFIYKSGADDLLTAVQFSGCSL